jgi:hypothetical protein
MTGLSRFAAVVLLLGALMGADGKCGEVKTDRPPPEHGPIDPRRERVVEIRITEATGPYTIKVTATDLGTAGQDVFGPEEIPGPGYVQTLRYESGARVDIFVVVRGHLGDVFECKITDGIYKVERIGQGGVKCSLITRR